MLNLVCLLAAYFLGSIPSGYLIVKHREGIDIRQTGSGATGATNVMRQSGLKAAALVYVMDVSKGAAAAGLALTMADGSYYWPALCGVAAVLGHIFPVWLRFRGGKGVATGFGVFLVLSPAAVCSALAVWLLVAAVFRYSSLASIVATASVPMWVWFYSGIVFQFPFERWSPILAAALTSCVVVVAAHRQNIRRLIRGTENHFGQKRAA